MKKRKKDHYTLLLLWMITILFHVGVARGVAAAFSFPTASTTSTSLRRQFNALKAAEAQTSSAITSKKTAPSSSSKNLHKILQQSYTVTDILRNVACQLSPENDPSVCSLTLVRLSKHMVTADNELYKTQDNDEAVSLDSSDDDDDNTLLLRDGLQNTIKCFVAADWTSASTAAMDSVVDGIKSTAAIARLLSCRKQSTGHTGDLEQLWAMPIVDKLHDQDSKLASLLLLRPHHLSGLQWSLDCFRLVANTKEEEYQGRCQLPPALQQRYNDLRLPFRIRPGFLGSKSVLADFESPNDAVLEFVKQVDFQSDTIKTTSNRLVKERRQTAWQGDGNVAPFAYSGKSMPRKDWSPMVEAIRDDLHKYTSQYYDGCLLNYYPDGESGMRYHSDPDQGDLWGYETSVVSVGATRRFAFRPIDTKNDGNNSTPHSFLLFNGDVTEMFGDCQQRYQHTVKTADMKKEQSSRVSLVFKKTLDDMRT